MKNKRQSHTHNSHPMKVNNHPKATNRNKRLPFNGATHLMYTIERIEIETGTVDRIVNDFSISGHGMLSQFAGKVAFAISGYDDSPVALATIDAVRSFIHKLTDAGMPWMHYMDLTHSWLSFLLQTIAYKRIVSDSSAGCFIELNPKVIEPFIIKQCNAMNAYNDAYGRPYDVIERSKRIYDCVCTLLEQATDTTTRKSVESSIRGKQSESAPEETNSIAVVLTSKDLTQSNIIALIDTFQIHGHNPIMLAVNECYFAYCDDRWPKPSHCDQLRQFIRKLTQHGMAWFYFINLKSGWLETVMECVAWDDTQGATLRISRPKLDLDILLDFVHSQLDMLATAAHLSQQTFNFDARKQAILSLLEDLLSDKP